MWQCVFAAAVRKTRQAFYRRDFESAKDHAAQQPVFSTGCVITEEMDPEDEKGT